MAIHTNRLFSRLDCALHFWEDDIDGVALIKYRRANVEHDTFAICHDQEEIDEINNSKYVDKKSIEQLKGV